MDTYNKVVRSRDECGANCDISLGENHNKFLGKSSMTVRETCTVRCLSKESSRKSRVDRFLRVVCRWGDTEHLVAVRIKEGKHIGRFGAGSGDSSGSGLCGYLGVGLLERLRVFFS